jgi:CBS domain-containing protein
LARRVELRWTMLVQEVMTEEVVTCPVNAALDEAAERMVESGVGSVIVTADGNPTGIVTETDALRAGAVADRPFSEIDLRKVANSPLETIPPGATVRDAVDQMRSRGVKKLPVVEQLELRGIVTTTDVARHYSSIVKEAHETASQYDGWTAEEEEE